MDAFFASVEQRDNPKLQGKPVVVGGEQRGVVAAASYEARAFGIRSAMPSYKAKQLCPEVIFVQPQFNKYLEASKSIRKIFTEYTDLVEPLSLDEAFLDVTENKFNNPSATKIAITIQQKIKHELNLTASAGISFNKFLAKVASNYRKPSGITLIDPEHAQNFVDNLAVEKFFGIGRATTRKMHNLKIYKGLDIRNKGLEFMQANFGKSGLFYYYLANCQDNRSVNPTRIRKSIGVENTFFTDLKTLPEIESELKQLCEKLVERLNKNLKTGKTITLKIRFSDFQTLTRSKTIPNSTNDFNIIYTQSLAFTKEFIEYINLKGVRLLGISVSNLDNHKPD